MSKRKEPSINMTSSELNQIDKTEKTLEDDRTKLAPFDVKFLGTGKEYFGIWIVNLILTQLRWEFTVPGQRLGAKTYFKNNTRIFDSGFGYHATGGQIFKVD